MLAIKPSTCRGRTLRGHLSIQWSLVSSVKPVIVGPVISSASFAVYSCRLWPQIHHFVVPLVWAMPEGSWDELLRLQHTAAWWDTALPDPGSPPQPPGTRCLAGWKFLCFKVFRRVLSFSSIYSGVCQSSRAKGGKFWIGTMVIKLPTHTYKKMFWFPLYSPDPINR